MSHMAAKNAGTISKQKPETTTRTSRSGIKTRGIGVVRYCVHGTSKAGSADRFSTPKLLKALEAGLPVQELVDLQASLAVPMEKLVPMLRMSKATLHRRK